MLQVGVELVPLTLSCHLAPALSRVKSVRLRDNVVVLLPPEPVEPPELAPLVTELYTLQVWVYPPAMVAL